MTVLEYFKTRAERGMTTEVLVRHPDMGELTVQAYLPIDAKCQAATIWGLGVEELSRMQVGIRRPKGGNEKYGQEL